MTKRGSRHLADLATMVDAGHRAVMLYLIQRTDCTEMDFARDIDSAYGEAFDEARARGVEAIAYTTHITTTEVIFGSQIPIRI